MSGCVSSGGPLPTHAPCQLRCFPQASGRFGCIGLSSPFNLTHRDGAAWGCEQNGEVTKKITNIARFINSQKRKGQAAGKENQVSR